MFKFLFNFKATFHIANIFLIILYTYPGSFIGCYLYQDCNVEPQITKNFLISSNHFYAFIILTFLALLAYKKSYKIKYVIFYLLFLSIFLEILHLIIPVRYFELSDLFGNLIGVLIVISIRQLLKRYEIFKF